MRAFDLHSLAIAAAAVVGMAGPAFAEHNAAQLLNSVEVQQLVARGEPSDNSRLAQHFLALADRYAAEAKKHQAMSQSFVGNPSRNLGVGMSAHCTRLADLNAQSATTLRELAAYHEKLAGGVDAVPPKDAARFQGGAGASAPTDKELNALALKARTAVEHRTLEEYFLMLAKRYTADASQHVALAQAYRGTRLASSAFHHDYLAKVAREAAAEATAGARMHGDLATLPR